MGHSEYLIEEWENFLLSNLIKKYKYPIDYISDIEIDETLGTFIPSEMKQNVKKEISYKETKKRKDKGLF